MPLGGDGPGTLGVQGTGMCSVAAWKDGWWRHAIRGPHYTAMGPGRSRLSRGHQALRKKGVRTTPSNNWRWWRIAGSCHGRRPCTTASLEFVFVDRILRDDSAQRAERMHVGRWLQGWVMKIGRVYRVRATFTQRMISSVKPYDGDHHNRAIGPRENQYTCHLRECVVSSV